MLPVYKYLHYILRHYWDIIEFGNGPCILEIIWIAKMVLVWTQLCESRKHRSHIKLRDAPLNWISKALRVRGRSHVCINDEGIQDPSHPRFILSAIYRTVSPAPIMLFLSSWKKVTVNIFYTFSDLLLLRNNINFHEVYLSREIFNTQFISSQSLSHLYGNEWNLND